MNKNKFTLWSLKLLALMLAVILEDCLCGVVGKIKCLIHFNMLNNPAE